MLICPEASSAQNNMAAVSADGSTVCVLILRLNSSCSPAAQKLKAAPAAKPGRSESYNESGCGDMQPSQIAGYFRALFGAGTTCSRVKERAFSCSSVDFTSMGKLTPKRKTATLFRISRNARYCG